MDAWSEARSCTRCPELAVTRRQVVFGAGNADADLMFVSDAPGAREDEEGRPLLGAAGRLLDELLEGIGLERADVFTCHVLCCRPPGNRDPQPFEIDNCHPWLLQRVDSVRPRVICPLGNFATKLLRGDSTPLTALHGRAEVHVVGALAVRIYPLFHPAAALYTRALQDTLAADMARLPALLDLDPPERPDLDFEEELPEPEPVAPAPPVLTLVPDPEPEPDPADEDEPPPLGQLELF